MNQTKIDWGNTQILVPNFRNGDVFYVIYQQEIVAIRLDKSYIETGRNYGQFNLKGVATPANNNDNLKGDVFFFIESDNGNRIRVSFFTANRYNWLYVYNSVEDAKIANISRNVVDIVNMPIYTKGITKGCLELGSSNCIKIFSWRSWKNQPKEDCSFYYTMLFYNDGLVLSNGTTPVMIAGYDTKEEVCNAIRAKLGLYKVCTFEDEKKETPKEYTITITINSDMTAMDILEKIKKTTEN